MARYKVTISHDIGSMIVDADSPEEAKEKVKPISFFSHGYSGNLYKTARKLKEF